MLHCTVMTTTDLVLRMKEKCTSNDRATIGNASASVADGLFSAFFSTILINNSNNIQRYLINWYCNWSAVTDTAIPLSSRVRWWTRRKIRPDCSLEPVLLFSLQYFYMLQFGWVTSKITVPLISDLSP